MTAKPKEGAIRITLTQYHPWIKGAIVIISRYQGGRWQLVRSSGGCPTADDPSLRRFLAWARTTYPQATFREVGR